MRTSQKVPAHSAVNLLITLLLASWMTGGANLDAEGVGADIRYAENASLTRMNHT
jgi:hypothetical protein